MGEVKIRKAEISDFKELYEIGKNTPELRVSGTEVFMDADEFEWAIKNSKSVFLVAEHKKQIVGFIYTSAKDLDKPFQHRYACLVYIVVLPEFRRKGTAKKLYNESERRLRTLGITHNYLWANIEGNGEIVKFMKNRGFKEGHKYMWMDKKI